MDSMRAHITEDIKKKVKEENMITAIIPRGLTKILQQCGYFSKKVI